MWHRSVGELMTDHVVRATPDTPFKVLAGLLAEHGITALPVVNERDCPVGMVSEADLLRHQAVHPAPGGRAREQWLRPRERERVEAETAGGLMSSPAITARPGWSVVEAARTMEQHGVKRLPVVDDSGRLVGIVSRGDLLRPFLRRDAEIHDEITAEVLERTLEIAPGTVAAEVNAGVVTLRGSVRPRLAPLLVRLCQAVDGVVAVHHEELSERPDGG